jgi:hypothetical protein
MTCAVSERLRCEALIYQGYVDGTTDAAGAPRGYAKAGRFAGCTRSPSPRLDTSTIGFDRVGIYTATMARAMSPLSTAYADMIARAIERQAVGA